MNILVCFPESVYSFISLSLSLQVSGKLELEKALIEFFTDEAVLEARRKAAKEAFNHLSSDIIGRIWSSLEFHIFSKLSTVGFDIKATHDKSECENEI